MFGGVYRYHLALEVPNDGVCQITINDEPYRWQVRAPASVGVCERVCVCCTGDGQLVEALCADQHLPGLVCHTPSLLHVATPLAALLVASAAHLCHPALLLALRLLRATVNPLPPCVCRKARGCCLTMCTCITWTIPAFTAAPCFSSMSSARRGISLTSMQTEWWEEVRGTDALLVLVVGMGGFRRLFAVTLKWYRPNPARCAAHRFSV